MLSGDLPAMFESTMLIGQLAQHGIKHLRAVGQTGESTATNPATDVAMLITALARHPQPRLREALIPLFLRHPEYANFVPAAVATLDSEAALRLRHLYTAAVYLQRLWQTTLTLYLGEFAPLPDFFGETYYQLPSPEERFGEAGLRVLAAHFKQRTGFDWLSVYNSTISLLLKQLSLERYTHDNESSQ